jgi:ribosomal protein S1
VIEADREKDQLILSEKAIGQELRRRKLEDLNVGQILFCRVLNAVDFGLFVDLGGVTGLIHISEFAWERVENPNDKFSFGDEVLAKIIAIDVQREQVKLSCKALIPNPWHTIGEQHKVGDWVEGRVTGIKDYGAFVKLPSGFEGLIHISEMSYESEISPHELFKLDERVRIRILDIDPARERISLSVLDPVSGEMNSVNLS